MDEQLQKLVDRIRQAQNVLVTVSASPSVDQLAAAIGLTLALNKLDKHGTAVFSGAVPSTIEFLKPEETLEKNTDSLRDFIIALDKSKADKLRYKVEDEVVRIFITPYRTSLSEKDLNFSQGDFNVDVVVALGVTEQQDLDGAITAHGRILHDATVASLSTTGQGSLGTINWVDPTASSLSEMVVALAEGLDKKVIDNQIATALLTGIVANTERFRNDKTTPKTMSAASALMAAGANQQLIATELEAADPTPSPDQPFAPPAESGVPESEPVENNVAPRAEPGTLAIDHDTSEENETPLPEPEEPKHPQVHVDEDGNFHTLNSDDAPQISSVHSQSASGGFPPNAEPEIKRERIIEPPQLGGSDLTANIKPETYEPSTEELTEPPVNSPLLTHNETVLGDKPAPAPFTPPPVDWTPPPQTSVVAPTPITPNETLADIEKLVDSPHAQGSEATTVDSARSAVEAAFSNPVAPVTPVAPEAFSVTQPQSVIQPQTPPPVVPNAGFSEPTPGNSPADAALDMPLPSNPFGPGQQLPSAPNALPPLPGAQLGQSTPSQTPPPVPPPMLPPLQ